MKKSRFTDSQIMAALTQIGSYMPIMEWILYAGQ